MRHAVTSWSHVAHPTPVELGSVDGLTAGSQTETDTTQTTCMTRWNWFREETSQLQVLWLISEVITYEEALEDGLGVQSHLWEGISHPERQ